MPLDAVCLSGVVGELRETILGLRVEKIQQPARDQIILTLRGNKKLLMCAGASQSRLHLTGLTRENPAAPPMFCMLLRKHLSGGRLAAIDQPGLERVVILTLDIVDELGEPGRRQLVFECMGRYSNLILLDGQERIIDCLRRVDMEMSEKRQVLPGLFYHLPPAQEKLDPLSAGPEDFRDMLAAVPDGTDAAQWLLDRFYGLSPLVCRELATTGCGDREHIWDAADRENLTAAFSVWQETVRGENGRRFTPWMLIRDGKPSDFSYIPIYQYGSAMEGAPWDAFSPMLDAFYETREQLERIRQRGADLQRAASSARDRACRKLALQEKEYAQTQDRDHLRVSGELITANLYRMERGQSLLRAQNYYEEGCPEVDIPLDPLLTPQQNAAKYYKRYAKAKTAEKYLREQMDLARRDLEYLESVLAEIAQAETEQDFLDIRAELREAGFLKKQGKGKKDKSRPAAPWEFRTSSGLRVLVGRNNRQNDKLTLKDADRRDLWLHTQKIHGSHVILRCAGQAPAEEDIVQAAMLAAWFSQARESGNVPVDYTEVRNVKKPAGGRPGMVIYTTCRTVNVTPEEAAVKRLRVK